MSRRLVRLAISLVLVLGALPTPALATDPAPGTPHPRNASPQSPQASDDVSVLSTFSGAVVDNGLFQLGINPEADMNLVGAGSPSAGSGTTTVGLRYEPENTEVLAPGCLCEGWGLGDRTTRVSGWANRDYGGPSANLTVVDFQAGQLTPGVETARSVVEIGTTYRVTHEFTPARETPNLYEILVTIENISDAPVDAVYRRVMDWDVEPTYFDEFVTIDGSSPYLIASTNDGFAHPDPLRGPTDLGSTGTFTDVGPFDHGALFDFAFGSIEPDDSKQFRLFYGAAPSEEVADFAIDAVSAEVWSFGQPNTPDGPTLGTPNTFIFAFAGSTDYCDAEDLVELPPSGVAGEPQVTINYDLRFAAPSYFQDVSDDALRAAQEVQDRAESSIVAYRDQGFDMPDVVTIDIVCDYPALPDLVIPDGVPAFTYSDGQIYVLADRLRTMMQAAVKSTNEARLNDEQLPARGLRGAARTPASEWVSLIDHELAHTWQYREFVLAPDLWAQLILDNTIIESGAVVSQDLLSDADDLPAPLPDTYDGSYLREVANLFDFHASLDSNAYDSAAILQYWGERFGQGGHPDLERQVGAFLEALVRPIETGLVAMNSTIADCPDRNCPDLFDALRDFYIAAYVLDADNVTSLDNRDHEILDTTVAHGDPAGPIGGPNAGGQTYPSYALALPQRSLPAGGNQIFADQTLRAGGAAVYEVAIPAGVTQVTVALDTTASFEFDTGLLLAAIPRDADGNAVIDRAFMRSAQRPFSDGATFDVPVSPGGRLGLVLVGTKPLFLFAPLTDANFSLTVSDTNAALRAAILPPPASDATFDPTRACTELTIAVDVSSGGTFYPGLPDGEFSASLDGSALTLARVWRRDDRYVLFADYAGPLSNASHTITVNVRGATDSYTITPASSAEPVECDEVVLAGWQEIVAVGETRTTMVDVSPASTFTATASWPGSDYDLVLTSPSGRTIPEVSTDPDVTVEQGGNTVSIIVAGAEVGEWQLSVTGVDLPDGPEAVTLTALETAPAVRADLGLANTAGAGTPIAVQLALRDVSSVIGEAHVTARVIDPAGITRGFPLTDDGRRGDELADDGVYSADLWATDAAGTYAFTVEAAGVDTDGNSFSRVEEQTLVLGAKVDTDGDGVADASEPLFAADPANAADGEVDIDDDGRSLAVELAAGLDPYSWDTDAGGETDSSEIAAGREPRLAGDDAPIAPVAVLATPRDGGLVTVTVLSDDPTVSVRLTRLPTAGAAVNLGTHPGPVASIDDGPLGDGDYQYRAIVTTAAGVEGAPAYSRPVRAAGDVTPPTARLLLEGDRWETNHPAVRVFFSGLSEPIAEMRLATSEAVLTEAAWIPFTSTAEVTIDGADGDYTIFAQLRDAAGLVSTPLRAATLTLDTTLPATSVGALPTTTNQSALSVPFTATDIGTGLNYAELWLRHRLDPGSEWGRWTMVATGDLSPFTIGLPFGEGSYELYTIGVDTAGNREAAPASADGATTYDITPPVSQAAPLNASYSTETIDVPYTASDDLSGVASVELWWRYRADESGAWSDWTLGPTGIGSPIAFGFSSGDGFYEFYTIALDNAGNREAAPTAADTGTQHLTSDTTPPSSSAGAIDGVYTTASVNVPYTANDENSGVASVELWARHRRNEVKPWSEWALSATASSSPIAYAFTPGDGNYEFYTIAVDNAGNREGPPAAADIATRRDAVDDSPDFAVTLYASRTADCQQNCPTGGGGSSTVALTGDGNAVDDRSTVGSVAWRLFGVNSDGSTRRLTSFAGAVPGDGAFDERLEGFSFSDSRRDSGYVAYDVEIKVTAGGLTTTRTDRVAIVDSGGGSSSSVQPPPP
ncbi:MAG: hypothetical protein M3406_14305 [Chloroflexota bacterium]|nr:hypothetical protein [Chloroflexota bacterium]